MDRSAGKPVQKQSNKLSVAPQHVQHKVPCKSQPFSVQMQAAAEDVIQATCLSHHDNQPGRPPAQTLAAQPVTPHTRHAQYLARVLHVSYTDVLCKTKYALLPLVHDPAFTAQPAPQRVPSVQGTCCPLLLPEISLQTLSVKPTNKQQMTPRPSPRLQLPSHPPPQQ